MDPVYMWLIALVTFLVIEIATMGLTTIWFAGGAIAALVLALVGTAFWMQVGSFLVISIFLLICTRPFAMKFFNEKREKTNIDGMIGRQAVVLAKIDNRKEEGQVLVNGMEWTARAYDDKVIEKDAVVEVKEVRGVKLIVVEKEKE